MGMCEVTSHFHCNVVVECNPSSHACATNDGLYGLCDEEDASGLWSSRGSNSGAAPAILLMTLPFFPLPNHVWNLAPTSSK
mmetsp:Transcript_5494/g.8495  ORF Transcript_5494/g.8495 Transcript_5494/m.8495 type:complete len:81 (+) Transcript_5494:1-243(+)